MEIVSFKTKVKVFRNTRAENGKLIRTNEIFRGLVTRQTNSFVGVWNPEIENSARNPEDAEWFPVAGKDCWCEIIEEPIPKSRSATSVLATK